MTGQAVPTQVPSRDRPLVLYDLLEQIAWLQAVGADPAEVEGLAEEYRRLRAEL
jgi:hypothetical protein